ncbi:LuxR C-terminal-related transcriptional regulator [Paenibacillus sp. WLX2291]|uniref:LuxR C-terminal-related transcriptional regulator n=1 Tax=Paenibacillus sp. WLX2291 TaxID=3296934 RepID=UPI0039845382
MQFPPSPHSRPTVDTPPHTLPDVPHHLPAALDKEMTSSIVYRQQLLDWLNIYMPFGGACCTMVDPDSLLSAGAVVEQQLESIHTGLLHYEYQHAHAHDAYVQLVHAQPPVSVLSQHDSSILLVHPRYCELLQPAGFADELRAALMYKGKCWGFLTLYRQQQHPLFSPSEKQWIIQLAPLIAERLRWFHLHTLQTAEHNDQQHDISHTTLAHTDISYSNISNSEQLHSSESSTTTVANSSPIVADQGILLLSSDLTILSSNRAASSWLEQLCQHENEETSHLPRPLHTAALQLLHQSAEAEPFQERVQSCIPANGRYIAISVQLLYTMDNDQQLFIEMTQASPEQLFQLRCDMFSLTTREQELIAHVIKGRSTRQIADQLYISSFTVQDHLKSIFAKTNTSSRRELLALLRSSSI